MPVHLGQQGGDRVVHVNQFELPAGIGNFNRQVVGNVVAERGHHRVVVGPAPFAENVLEPENGDRRPALRGELFEGRFGVPLAPAIGVVHSAWIDELRITCGVRPQLGEDAAQLLGRAGVARVELWPGLAAG